MRRPIVILLVLVSLSVQAQHPEIKSYRTSQLMGTSALEKALFYFQASRYDSSNKYFLEALNYSPLQAEEYLFFANGLMAEGKSALAREFFNEYLKAKDITLGPEYDLVQSLFSKDTSNYTSKEVEGSRNMMGIQRFDSKIYSSYKGSIHAFSYGINGSFNENRPVLVTTGLVEYSSIAFFNNGFSAVVTRTNTHTGGSSMYLIHLTEQGWTKAKKPLFNAGEANYCSPFFDEKNGILYFASDQSGSFGGYDIYMSYYKGGKFSTPVNLGDEVNTAGHEFMPRTKNGWLFFSSNGHPSLGGFDLYRFRRLDDYLTVLKNESKLNSSSDDYGSIELYEGHYLVNRYSSYGHTALLSIPKPSIEVTGQIVDQDYKPISGAVVIIDDASEGRYYKVDHAGGFSFATTMDVKEIKIGVYADGYRSVHQSIDVEISALIVMEPIRSIGITKVVRSAASDSQDVVLLPEGVDSVVVESPPALEEGVYAPKSGIYYVIVGSARSYTDAYDIWGDLNDEFNNLKIIKFNETLYRVGFECGTDEALALDELQDAISIIKDAWIIRPGTL